MLVVFKERRDYCDFVVFWVIILGYQDRTKVDFLISFRELVYVGFWILVNR